MFSLMRSRLLCPQQKEQYLSEAARCYRHLAHRCATHSKSFTLDPRTPWLSLRRVTGSLENKGGPTLPFWLHSSEKNKQKTLKRTTSGSMNNWSSFFLEGCSACCRCCALACCLAQHIAKASLNLSESFSYCNIGQWCFRNERAPSLELLNRIEKHAPLSTLLPAQNRTP